MFYDYFDEQAADNAEVVSEIIDIAKGLVSEEIKQKLDTQENRIVELEKDLEYYRAYREEKFKLDQEISHLKHEVIAEQWAKEHPVKTRQSEFLKIFPCEDLVNEDTGVLDIYPCNVGFIYSNGKFKAKRCSADMCYGNICDDCRKKFWLEEIEE